MQGIVAQYKQQSIRGWKEPKNSSWLLNHLHAQLVTRSSNVDGLMGVVMSMPGVLGLTSKWVAFVVTFVNCQSCPSIRYPISVLSMVFGPNVIAICFPVKPNFKPGELTTVQYCIPSTSHPALSTRQRDKKVDALVPMQCNNIQEAVCDKKTRKQGTYDHQLICFESHLPLYDNSAASGAYVCHS